MKNTPPSILGCFQLYKKKVYHRNNLTNASWGDYCFGYDNFNIFCNLENIKYFHLGESGVNWDGKVVSFIDDINISIYDIYYTCNKICKNIYYNSKCKIIGNKKIQTNNLKKMKFQLLQNKQNEPEKNQYFFNIYHYARED